MGSSNRPDLTSRMKNSSYIFVPFSHDDKFAGINVSSYWREKRQGNKYFLKYIVDKLSHDSTSVCCRPYLMDDLARSTLGIISSLQPYLYLYILALHQKYALYYFLTNFSIEQNMAGLEKKLQDLVNFKAKYVFEIISESETYQTVYYKQCKSFALEELYRDIDEQIF